jgi:putative Holliday junction resolvase
MSTGRILGLDPGERRVGLALSDPLGIIAQPFSVLDRDARDLVEQLANIIAENDVEAVVIGLPISLDGTEGPAARAARDLGSEVEQHVECDVTFFDERFTTVQAEAALLEGGLRRADRRAVRDKVAAALMLQGYLDSHRRDDR